MRGAAGSAGKGGQPFTGPDDNQGSSMKDIVVEASHGNTDHAASARIVDWIKGL